MMPAHNLRPWRDLVGSVNPLADEYLSKAQAAEDAEDWCPGHAWVHRKNHCDLCGEPLTEDDRAEVVDTTTDAHLIVHAEPCSYEHGDRYALA
jgi:hypothetical protein